MGGNTHIYHLGGKFANPNYILPNPNYIYQNPRSCQSKRNKGILIVRGKNSLPRYKLIKIYETRVYKRGI